MFLELLSRDPPVYLAAVIVVIISITLHELAHGFTAIAFGDRTPEETGHITANPFVHMPPMSIVMLLLFGISWGLMPVDPTRMRGKYAESVVAFAGPLTNLVLSAIGVLALGLWLRFGTIDLDHHVSRNIYLLVENLASLNLVLFMLNLLPVPPLDGSRIVANFVPAYRNWMGDPAMSGVFLAMSFAVLFGVSRYLWPLAEKILVPAITVVAGR